MKTVLEIEISHVSLDFFFPKERIKSKFKIIEILLEACRHLLHGERESKVRSAHKIILFKDKMNRIFFVSPTKIYSITFPFNLLIENDAFLISYKDSFIIDSQSISNLLILLKDPLLNSDSCYDFIDPVITLQERENLNYWEIIKYLITFEDGYLRYDWDDEGYKEAIIGGFGDRHPLHHIDIFYTNSATFKIGLNTQLSPSDLINTLDPKFDCQYLSPSKLAKK